MASMAESNKNATTSDDFDEGLEKGVSDNLVDADEVLYFCSFVTGLILILHLDQK